VNLSLGRHKGKLGSSSAGIQQRFPVLWTFFSFVGDQPLRWRHSDSGAGAASRFLFDLDSRFLLAHESDSVQAEARV
jgi:hypothetical protein